MSMWFLLRGRVFV